MGCKSPVYESRYYQTIVAKILAEGKGDLVRGGLKEAGVQVSEERDSEFVGRRTETSYKAKSPGKSAFMPEWVQHDEARDSGDMVNDAVVQRKITPLSGEACSTSGSVNAGQRSLWQHEE